MNARPLTRSLSVALLLSAAGLVACQSSDSASGGGNTAGAAPVAGADAGGASPAGAGGSLSAAGTGGDSPLASGGTGAAAAAAGMDAVGGAPDPGSCADLTLASCSTNPDCQTLLAQRVTSMLCLTSAEPTACGTRLGCTNKATRAKDTTGQDWIFPSNCLPAGWPDTSVSGTRFDPCVGTAAGGMGGMGGGN